MGIFGNRAVAGGADGGRPRPASDRRSEEFAAVFASAPGAEREGMLAVPSWTSAEWSQLLARTEPFAVRTGDVVIERGERERNLWLVAAGRVEVVVPAPDAQSLGPLAVLGAGSVIGELAFFDGEGRSASVWAASDGVLLRLSESAFASFGEEHPALARDFLFGLGRVMAVRLRRTTSRRNR